MADSISHFVRFRTAGSADAKDLFYGAAAPSQIHRPLLSGSTQLFLSNNATHLSQENPLRTLCSHVGFRSFYAMSPNSTILAPTVDDVNWASRATGGVANMCLGTHVLHRHGATNQWPRLRLTWKWRVASTYTAGLYFGVAPGRNRFPSAADLSTGTTTTSTTYAPGSLTLTPTDAHLGTDPTPLALGASGSGATTPPEPLPEMRIITAWCGLYCSSDQIGNPADAVQFSLFLIPPA